MIGAFKNYNLDTHFPPSAIDVTLRNFPNALRDSQVMIDSYYFRFSRLIKLLPAIRQHCNKN